MSIFRRGKTAASPGTVASQTGVMTSAKIFLDFRRYSAQEVRDMAVHTLDAAAKSWVAVPQIGDTMPDGTIYAGDSPDTGKPTYAMAADAPLTMKWQDARDYAKALDTHGHKDWRLPTKGELNMLFNNRAAIGGFKVTGSDPAGWYWSVSQSSNESAAGQLFSSGAQGEYRKVGHSSVRCVR